MGTILQVRSNGQITLPAAIRRQAQLEEGDALEVIIEENGTIRLTPVLMVERSQAYFWSERWQEGEKEADEDILAGRVRDFDTIEYLLAELWTEGE
jgi:AbrB family looped-hinge helix DNA binding protein